jgi:hypothetical protein
MADNLPIKLPAGVDWHGPHDPLVRLMKAVYSWCTNYHGNCGTLPKTCSMCAMLTDQASLDRLMALDVGKTSLKEWKEVDRETFTVKQPKRRSKLARDLEGIRGADQPRDDESLVYEPPEDLG